MSEMSDGISMSAESRPEFTEDELLRARLAVCAEAKSIDEARMFLSMLGLA
ncbi:MAG: hypothetical protein ACKODT_07125 [Fluviibacter sp.]